MRISQIFPFVLSAGAFLVPANLKDSVGIVDTLPSSTKAQDVTIKCVGGCPVMMASGAENGVPTRWTKLYPGELHADIAIGDNGVTFNGQQLWPVGSETSQPLKFKQSTKGTTYEPFKGLMPASASLSYKKEEIIADSTTMMKVFQIDIKIFSIAAVNVHAQTIHVRVAETEHGLALLPTIVKDYVPSPYTDKCTTVWCRVSGTIAQKLSELRTAASQKINKWRGCGGQKKTHLTNGLPLRGGPAKFGPGSTLNPGKNHQLAHKTLGHHRHHRHHEGGLRRFVTMVFDTFVFPAIFGLSVGLIFGAISWLFVNAIRRLRNGPQAEYVIVEQVEVEEGLAGLPKYEEIYREPQTETEDEKKELLQ